MHGCGGSWRDRAEIPIAIFIHKTWTLSGAGAQAPEPGRDFFKPPLAKFRFECRIYQTEGSLGSENK